MIRLRWTSSRLNWTAAAALADATSDGFDLAEDFTLVTQQDDAPAAFHPAGELCGAVFFAGSAGHNNENMAPTRRWIEVARRRYCQRDFPPSTRGPSIRQTS